MFNHANLIDMYSVADPERCKQYIVAASTALDTIFSKVNLNPAEKDGTLYFQSVPGLLQTMTGDDRAKRQANCNKLAFYFIRIFQIFGALTLSVKDQAIPSSDPALEIVKNVRGYSPLVSRPLRGFPNVRNKPRPSWNSWQSGGAIRSTSSFYIMSESPYSILNYYLSEPDIGPVTNPMKFTSIASMTIRQVTLYKSDIGRKDLADPLNPIVMYRYKGYDDTYNLTGILNIEREDLKYYITLSDIKIDNRPAKTSTFKTTLTAGDSTDTSPINNMKQELPAALISMFKRALSDTKGFSIIEFLSEKGYININDNPATIKNTTRVIISSPDSVNRGNTAPIIFFGTGKVEGRTREISITARLIIDKNDNNYSVKINFEGSRVKPEAHFELQNRGPIIFTGDREPLKDGRTTIPAYIQSVFEKIIKGTGYEEQATGKAPKGPPSSDRIPSHLRIDGLWKALAKSPPAKTLCIGRALQLLNVNAIKGAISPTDFSAACNLSFALVKNGSVPAIGGKITNVPSISALASLYKGINGENLRDYEPFKEALNKVYDTDAEVEDITFKKPEVCERDSIITIPGETKSQLRSIVKGMIREQKAHTSEALKVIFMLFDEAHVRKGIFMFNKEVAVKGMPEIERIAGIARNLIARQLVNCELDYKKGLELLKGAKARNAPAPPAAAPPAAAGNEDDEENP